MSKPNQSVKAWIQKADNDWLNVQNNLASTRIPWDTVCFHAQQTAEKLLKAYLVFHGETPAKTHDLMALLDAVGSQVPDLLRYAGELKPLARFAAAGRYPGGPDPTAREGRSIVKNAQKVRTAILSRIEAKSVAIRGKAK